MKILITGSAGFIGYHLHKSILLNLIKKNQKIVGLDNLNNYYDVKLKKVNFDKWDYSIKI